MRTSRELFCVSLAALSGDSRPRFMRPNGAAGGTGFGWADSGTTCRSILRPLQPPRERSAASGQRIHPLRYVGIGDERRSVMRLKAGIDDERPGAAPMLFLGER